MSKRGQFEVHYPNGMRTRVDTIGEVFEFTARHYLVPLVVQSVQRDSELVGVFMHEWPEPPAEEPAPKCARCNDAGQVVYEEPELFDPFGRVGADVIPNPQGRLFSAPCPECAVCPLCNNERFVLYVDARDHYDAARREGRPVHLSSRPFATSRSGYGHFGACPKCLPHEVDANEISFAHDLDVIGHRRRRA